MEPSNKDVCDETGIDGPGIRTSSESISFPTFLFFFGGDGVTRLIVRGKTPTAPAGEMKAFGCPTFSGSGWNEELAG